MAHEDAPHYSRKHPSGERPDQRLAEAVRKKAVRSTIACSAAFEIVSESGAEPSRVGRTIDLLEVRLVRCQLGLFGYPSKEGGKALEPAATVSPELEKAIREKLADGRLACADAWAIAEALGLRRMEVSSAAEKLGVRIKPCQLGAF
ncbi:MAG: hypothetical protein AB1640_17685 [bacterium]